MSAASVHLSPQEALARDLIVERSAARHHVPERTRAVRRHVRAALLLRSLAERLDPGTPRPTLAEVTPLRPHAGSPRPWGAEPRPAARRAPHRHS